MFLASILFCSASVFTTVSTGSGSGVVTTGAGAGSTHFLVVFVAGAGACGLHQVVCTVYCPVLLGIAHL